MCYAIKKKENYDYLFLKCTLAWAVLFGLDLSIRTKFISPSSLKQWLAQWIEDPKFKKQEYLVFSRLMFKGAKQSA